MKRSQPQRRLRRLQQLISIMEDGSGHTADSLADRINASPRTIYRDISLLRHHGWQIPGEAGVGFIFKGQGSFDVLSPSRGA